MKTTRHDRPCRLLPVQEVTYCGVRDASQGTVSAESNGCIMTFASRKNHNPLYNALGVGLTDDTGHDKARLRLCVHMSQYEIALCGTTTRADGGAGYPRDLPPARDGPTLPEACMMTRGPHSTSTDVIRAKMASRKLRFDRLTTHTQTQTGCIKSTAVSQELTDVICATD